MTTPFLSTEYRPRKLSSPEYPEGLEPLALYLGKGKGAFEVAVFATHQKPTKAKLDKALRVRQRSRSTPVLVVVLHGTNKRKAVLRGGLGTDLGIMESVSADQAQRLAEATLNMPDYLAAWRFLKNAVESIESRLPGIRNVGMLATHTLRLWAQEQDPDHVVETTVRAKKVIRKKKQEQLEAMGYTVERKDNLTSILRISEKKTALAVLLEENESIEQSSARFNTLSPVTYAMVRADEENLPYVLMVKDTSLRLYFTEQGKAVSRRARTEAYLECQKPLLSESNTPCLWWFFSADALKEKGWIEKIHTNSQRFAAELAVQLRERIYDNVMPALIEGIVQARHLPNPTPEDLKLTYEMAMIVLFRLLFIAYAEDCDLLPYTQNTAYRNQSLKEKAKELLEQRLNLGDIASANEVQDVGRDHDLYRSCASLFEAVSEGSERLGVPPYNGVLFSADNSISKAGAALKGLAIGDQYFVPALDALLIARQSGECGPVDFRSLSVREFGTIYEGLLESELAIADTDMAIETIKKEDVYVPAREGDKVVVHAGKVYLHDKSGARKSTGSYYTKHFVVDYLLDQSLQPALEKHFERLDGMETDADASDAFFDFRVADIAMGSGHFLVAAVDRIEAGMASYLRKREREKRPLVRVHQELQTLRFAACNALGTLKDTVDIEDSQLLRRQIARRCIYGVDLNPLAVQLARLGVWVHTFVPGLPLSLLDHNLVLGDALIGVGTVKEIKAKFAEFGNKSDSEGQLVMKPLVGNVDHLLKDAKKLLRSLATLKDATPADIEKGRQAMRKARKATQPVEALCDIITAQPISKHPEVRGYAFDQWKSDLPQLDGDQASLDSWHLARQDLKDFQTFHFPVQFPEVFIGDRPGFDVVLGNPPWEKVKVEEDRFWMRYISGLRALEMGEKTDRIRHLKTQREDLQKELQQEVEVINKRREILVNPRYPGMGTGDPDLYKAFCWRFWHLIREKGGCLGVVLPRSALNAKGSESLRKTLFEQSAELHITTVRNKGRWVFNEVHDSYTIGFLAAERGISKSPSIRLEGPYTDWQTFNDGTAVSAEEKPNVSPMQNQATLEPLDSKEILSWNGSAALPLLPSPDSFPVFKQLRKAPWVCRSDHQDSWRVFPHTELHATNDKPLMSFSDRAPVGFWPVWKGATFDIWSPDSGTYYGYVDSRKIQDRLLKKRLNKNSKFRPEFDVAYLQDDKNLECNHARIAFRNLAASTNKRTLIACLVPPCCLLQHSASYLIWPKGNVKDQAYLLGILCSLPMDWFARRFVEINVSAFIFENFPVPRPSRENPLWERVVALAGRLACPDKRFAVWAKQAGVEWGPLNSEDKDRKIYELDAVAAHLYGLSLSQLEHIFETFHVGWDYKTRLKAVTRFYLEWQKKLK